MTRPAGVIEGGDGDLRYYYLLGGHAARRSLTTRPAQQLGNERATSSASGSTVTTRTSRPTRASDTRPLARGLSPCRPTLILNARVTAFLVRSALSHRDQPLFLRSAIFSSTVLLEPLSLQLRLNPSSSTVNASSQALLVSPSTPPPRPPRDASS